MAILKLKRGLEADRTSFTPAEGELLVTTDNNTLYIGDGSTIGGNPIVSENLTQELNDNIIAMAIALG